MQIRIYTIDVPFPRWLKRACVFGVFPAVILLGLTHYLRADVTLPNTFKDGDTLSAKSINDNFATVATGINTLGATVTTLQGTVAGNTTPPGSVIAFAGSVPPSGWLVCDGSAVSRTQYPALYATLGVTYGIGDAMTTFNLPDYRGRFLRGVDHGAKTDPDAADRKAVGGGVGADAVGTMQDDAFKSHNHTGHSGTEEKYTRNGLWYDGPTWAADNGSSFGLMNSIGGGSHTHPIPPEGGNETRPKNAAVDFIIKY